MILGVIASAIRSANATPSYDPYFDKVALLLHAESPDGSGTIVDSSSNARTPSSKQDVVIQASTHKVGEGALRGLGTPPILTYGPSTDFDLAGVYTFEFWLYLTEYPDGTAYWMANSATAYFTLGPSGAIGSNGSGLSFGPAVPLNTWVHFAGVRDSQGVAKGFRDGKLVSTDSSNQTKQGSSSLGLFSIPGRTDLRALKGYIDEFRWTAGVARYTSDFTPSTTSFPDKGSNSSTPSDTATDSSWSSVRSLLRMDTLPTQDLASSSPSWQKFGTGDLQSTVKLFNQQTMQMNGATALESNIPFSILGAADYTAEIWFYPTKKGSSDTDYQRIISVQSDSNDVLIGRLQGARMQVVMYVAAAGGFFNSLPAPNFNAWNHLAIQRRSDTWEIFLNGTKIGSAAVVGGALGSATICLGGARRGDGGKYDEYFIGYISNFRATAGIARYTDGYTLPTDRFPKQ